MRGLAAPARSASGNPRGGSRLIEITVNRADALYISRLEPVRARPGRIRENGTYNDA